MTDDEIKVLWRLEQDEDEWPPYPVESIWCKQIATGRFKLLNVPYFAHGVAWGDVVTAVEDGGGLWFEAVIQRSGFVTLHAYCKEPAQQLALRDWLKARDCIVETAFDGKYWALGIPPAVPRDEWEGFLTRLAREDGTGLEFDVASAPGDLRPLST
ncbi:DUF4265 domain-containing protein [Roseateles terrae]|uniref:DUF4265 domain-containing protein n=1 Tax=Roseateles terrae TaxID=431060 RepID=A0ABR6GNB4_9BURK|nr:DUF4265 domain-containing protein [Roseateles terrae]MBB3192643.1 hypothetical protein [Roseateles terrae]OWQ90064.1 hypothetical protein CDN98_06205 [Roseateles terrae]